MLHPVSGDCMYIECSGIARSNESVRTQTAWLQARLSGVHSGLYDEYSHVILYAQGDWSG